LQTCLGAFLSYYLVKVVPYWGLALIATTVVFFAPLIYTSNQELIDHHVKQASDVVNAQTAQLRDLAQKHTEQATQITKQYMGDYSAKAQAMIRGARGTEPKPEVRAPEFPPAPTHEFKTEEAPVKHEEEEPLIAA
jgi:hypothetical protein